MNSKELKTREQIDKKYKWNIEAMICDESSVNSDLDSIKAQKNMRQTTQEDLQKMPKLFWLHTQNVISYGETLKKYSFMPE